MSTIPLPRNRKMGMRQEKIGGFHTSMKCGSTSVESGSKKANERLEEPLTIFTIISLNQARTDM